MSVKSFIRNMRFSARDFLYNRKQRKILMNKEFSLITSDCIGGCVAKDLKVRMNSPTRNFYFNADDYIKFILNLDYYLALQPEPYGGKYSGGGLRVFNGRIGGFEAVFSTLFKC